MRVKVISRSTDDYTRERSQDLQKVFRNYDPALRSQEKAVEYTRALNAAKLEKIFAKPFIGAMDGHIDAVSCMTKNPNHLKAIFSGSMDGDIRLWDIAARKTVCQFPGHQGAVRGLTTSTDGDLLVSCGVDCIVRLWKDPMLKMVDASDRAGDTSQPSAVYTWKHAFWGADHQWDGNLFATVGAQVDIWDPERSEPISSFEWGKDTVLSVRFDPGDCNILITSGSDRSLTLYDLRMSSPARKLIMKTRCNSVCWNPREPMNFTAANEDTNCYSFDARKLDEAKIVHKGHVSAVMDIDYSPTGREFVTGSYDRTVRIFYYLGDHSREIYHTKRMQRVFCVKYTYDGTYLVSGSDDTNLRLWKSKASEQLGVPFWKVLQEGSSRGRSVVGVLEANFIEPAHDKQDFERTPLFIRLEARLRQIIIDFWKEKCHLIGYQPMDPQLRSQYKATLKDSGGPGTQVHHKASSARRTGGLSSNLLPQTYDDITTVGLANNGSYLQSSGQENNMESEGLDEDLVEIGSSGVLDPNFIEKLSEENIALFSRREELRQRDTQLKQTIGDLERELEETKKKCGQLAAQLKAWQNQQYFL